MLFVIWFYLIYVSHSAQLIVLFLLLSRIAAEVFFLTQFAEFQQVKA